MTESQKKKFCTNAKSYKKATSGIPQKKKHFEDYLFAKSPLQEAKLFCRNSRCT